MRSIDADAALDALIEAIVPAEEIGFGDELTDGYNDGINIAIEVVSLLPTVDAVPVVRCKDCKHRPTDDLEFPDDECPCQCEDFWYNWKPADEWYCGNGERKDGDRHDQSES